MPKKGKGKYGLGKRQATDTASLAEIVASHQKKQKTDDEQEQHVEKQVEPKQATQEQPEESQQETEQPPSEFTSDVDEDASQPASDSESNDPTDSACPPRAKVKQDAAGISLKVHMDLAESCFKTMSANDREHLREICRDALMTFFESRDSKVNPYLALMASLLNGQPETEDIGNAFIKWLFIEEDITDLEVEDQARHDELHLTDEEKIQHIERCEPGKRRAAYCDKHGIPLDDYLQWLIDFGYRTTTKTPRRK
tara:strand:+ start:288 stop:1049 length:762 start_codon:yes stop_codon:yes gene_type:complete